MPDVILPPREERQAGRWHAIATAEKNHEVLFPGFANFPGLEQRDFHKDRPFFLKTASASCRA